MLDWVTFTCYVTKRVKRDNRPFTLTPKMSASVSLETKEHDEWQYLRLVRRVLDTGEVRTDRTGTGTISLFAPPSLRFSLAETTFPLVTTKRTFLRGIVEELLWFIRGSTDSTLLSKKGVKIWDGNGSKNFLESRGLGHRREGDLGPVYGFQWRHFGAQYVDCEADYTGQGVDQLRECIKKIKENPTDRRIILSAWNPKGGKVFPFTFSLLLLQQIYPTWLCLRVTCSVNSMFIFRHHLHQPLSGLNFPVSCTNGLPILVSVSHSTSPPMLSLPT